MSNTNKTKYLLKNMGLLTISNFASRILVFLLVPLYTSVLTTAEYGAYDLGISTASLLYPILTLNIVDAVMRFTMDKSYAKDEVASIGFRYVSFSCIIAGAFLAILFKFGIWQDIHGLEGYVFLYYISYVFNQFFIQLSKGLERVTDMAVSGVISTIVMISTNLLFLLIFRLGLQGFFVANIISQVVSICFFCIRLKAWRYLHFSKTNKELSTAMLTYCVPLIAATLGWWVNSTSDKYIVAFLCGVSANGILSVSYKIPQIINTFQSIFIQAWQITAIIEYGENDTKSFYGNTFGVINLLMCMACSWLILLTKPLATLLFANDFYEAWKYGPFLLISSVLNCASGLLGPILSAKKNSKAMMWSAIIGAGSNVVLNVILVFCWGIQGATIATVFSSYIIYWIRKKAVADDIFINQYPTIVITWILLCIQAVIEITKLSVLIELLLMIIMLILNKRRVFELVDSLKRVITK
ncbi:MAG: lipopolysaccharide biosynthesis protein [Anaerostipes sp.]|jgi:O-antigen/teichoic acid export membrane protein